MEINEYEQVWEIWNKSKDKLYAYVLSRFNDAELAKEVTQEVLLKIHSSCCSGKQINNLKSWLYQIAHNASLDILTKERKQKDRIPLDDDKNDLTTWDELSVFLEDLINFLPEKYALPLKMSDLEGIAQKDIAVKLNLGLSATKSRIQRAREQLRQEIETCFHLETSKNGSPISIELKDSCSPLKNK